MRRARTQEFAEVRKLKEVKRFINHNRNLFRLGAQFGEDRILDHFDVPQPDYTDCTPQEVISKNNTYISRRCEWQNRFNRLLAQSGLYMSKKHGEPIWSIKTLPQARQKVDSFRIDASRKVARANELEAGIENRAGAYSPRTITNNVIERIAATAPSNWGNSDWAGTDRPI